MSYGGTGHRGEVDCLGELKKGNHILWGLENVKGGLGAQGDGSGASQGGQPFLHAVQLVPSNPSGVAVITPTGGGGDIDLLGEGGWRPLPLCNGEFQRSLPHPSSVGRQLGLGYSYLIWGEHPLGYHHCQSQSHTHNHLPSFIHCIQKESAYQ